MPFVFNPLSSEFDYYQAATGGTPGGAPTSIQYNNAGAFGGFGTWDGSTMTVPGTMAATLVKAANVTSGLIPFGSTSITGLLDVSASFYLEDGNKLKVPRVVLSGNPAIDLLGGRMDFYSGASVARGSLRVDSVGIFGFGNTSVIGNLDFTSIASSDKTFTFPNTSGTIALTSNLTSFIDGTLTATRVPFALDSNTLEDDSGFVYDKTNNFLGVNKATPLGHVHAGADTITTATPTSFSSTANFGYSGYAFGSGNKNYSVYQRIGAIFSSALTGTYTELAATAGDFSNYTPAPNYSGSGYPPTGVPISFEAYAYFSDGTISPNAVTNGFTDNGTDPYSITHTWSTNLGNPNGILLIRDATDFLVVPNQSSPYEDTNTGWAALPHGLSTVSSYSVTVSAGFSASPTPNRTVFRNTTTSRYTNDDSASSSATDSAVWTSGSPTITPTSGPGFSVIADGTVRLGGTSNSSLGVFNKASAPAPYQGTTDFGTGLINYGFFGTGATLSTSYLSGTIPVSNGGTGLSTFSGTGRIPFAGSAGTSLTTASTIVILDSNRIGIGVSSPAAIGHFVGTGYPPIRGGYDTSNYINIAVSSAGAVTFDAVGASAAFNFSDSVNITSSLQCDSIVNDTGLAAGTWTPTRSAEANLDANVTMFQGQYMRVGNTVTVSGRFTADPTLTATATSFEMTLPVASNIGAVEDLAGTAFCGAIAGMGAQIEGSVANNTMVVSWVSTDVTSKSWSFTAVYQVI